MKDNQILASLGLPNPELLGKGMEGRIYKLDEKRVVKLWEKEVVDIPHLLERKKLLKTIAVQIDIPIPEIYEIGSKEDVLFTIERKLSGKQGNLVYTNLDDDKKHILLDNYFQILPKLKSCEMTGDYGQFLSSSGGTIHDSTWQNFLLRKLDETLQKIKNTPDHDIANVYSLFEKFNTNGLANINPKPMKSLVHGDLFLENVLVGENLEITGILDFSALSVVGDHLMDVAALCYFARVSSQVGEEAQTYLLNKSQIYYPGTIKTLEAYLAYFSLLFINSKKYDPRTYTWCIENLKKLGYL